MVPAATTISNFAKIVWYLQELHRERVEAVPVFEKSREVIGFLLDGFWILREGVKFIETGQNWYVTAPAQSAY